MDLELFTGVVPFVETVERGSFRAAAKALRVTPSAVSKAIAKLEDSLELRLLHRTTRSLRLTSDGQRIFTLYRDAVGRALSAREFAQQAQVRPSGLLRISAPPILGRTVLAPALPHFFSRYPDVRVQLVLTDRYVSFAEDNIDIALRIGSSDMDPAEAKIRRLHTPRWVTVASPGYLARYGTPEHPADLEKHECLRFIPERGIPIDWTFRNGTARISGKLTADNGDALIAAAVAGTGIVQAMDFMVADELGKGQVIEVLEDYAVDGPAISTLSAPRRSDSPKIRAFMEFAAGLFRK